MYDSTNQNEIDNYIKKCQEKILEYSHILKHKYGETRNNEYIEQADLDYWEDEFWLAIEAKEQLRLLNEQEVSNRN